MSTEAEEIVDAIMYRLTGGYAHRRRDEADRALEDIRALLDDEDA